MLHCKPHQNESHGLLKCFGAGGKHTLCRYGPYKVHFYWRHNVSAPVNVMCAMALCECQCQHNKDLIAQLKEQSVEGHGVSCPVGGCTNVFKVKSSFTPYVTET